MSKYNVCVYAICKNEAKFIPRWVQSMSEADEIYVLDTGSDDGSAQLLRELGVNVCVEEIKPWRFDTARNRSLSLIPESADICVCTDIDEIMRPGWRSAAERAWSRNVGRLKYRYTWSFEPDGREGCVFWIDKIHCRHGYRWVQPVHEVLTWCGASPEPESVFATGIQLDHFPDPAKSRGQYLPLLELAVKESPENDRSAHYLGREYMYHGMWEKAIAELERHLSLKSAVWRDERCASMRYIAKCRLALGDRCAAESWYLRAIAEAPHLREPWLDCARLAAAAQDWHFVIWLTGRAISISTRPATYITEADSWGSLPYDLASLGYYYTGAYDAALQMVDKALELSPADSRLVSNRKLIAAKAL